MIIMMLVEFRCEDYVFDTLGYRVFKTAEDFSKFMNGYKKLAGLDKDVTTEELCHYFDCEAEDIEKELDCFAKECGYDPADPAFYEMIRRELHGHEFEIEFGDSEYLTFDDFDDFNNCITVLSLDPVFIRRLMGSETVRGVFPKERR